MSHKKSFPTPTFFSEQVGPHQQFSTTTGLDLVFTLQMVWPGIINLWKLLFDLNRTLKKKGGYYVVLTDVHIFFGGTCSTLHGWCSINSSSKCVEGDKSFPHPKGNTTLQQQSAAKSFRKNACGMKCPKASGFFLTQMQVPLKQTQVLNLSRIGLQKEKHKSFRYIFLLPKAQFLRDIITLSKKGGLQFGNNPKSRWVKATEVIHPEISLLFVALQQFSKACNVDLQVPGAFNGACYCWNVACSTEAFWMCT